MTQVKSSLEKLQYLGLCFLDKKLNGKQAPKQPVETVAPEGESG